MNKIIYNIKYYCYDLYIYLFDIKLILYLISHLYQIPTIYYWYFYFEITTTKIL